MLGWGLLIGGAVLVLLLALTVWQQIQQALLQAL